jgi:hypothetical protein
VVPGARKAAVIFINGCRRLKIVKAKSRVDESINPNGLSINFKLVQGCKFVPQSNGTNNKIRHIINTGYLEVR